MDWTETQRFTFMKALIASMWLNKTVTAECLNGFKTYLRRVNLSEEERVGLKPFLGRKIRDHDGTQMVEDFLRVLPHLDQFWGTQLVQACCDLSEVITDETDDEFFGNVPYLFAQCSSSAEFVKNACEVFVKGGIAEPDVEPGRGDDLEEFVRNRIMSTVRAKMLDLNLTTTEMSAKEVAYITSLAALLGRIAHADEDFSEEEKVEISSLLKETTELKHQDIDVIMATIIDDTLKGMDLKSITRTYYNLSTAEQRDQLLNCLFLVAGADGHIDPAEVDEIERIAVSLNMSHRDILRAKAAAMEIVQKRLSADF